MYTRMVPAEILNTEKLSRCSCLFSDIHVKYFELKRPFKVTQLMVGESIRVLA